MQVQQNGGTSISLSADYKRLLAREGQPNRPLAVACAQEDGR